MIWCLNVTRGVWEWWWWWRCVSPEVSLWSSVLLLFWLWSGPVLFSRVAGWLVGCWWNRKSEGQQEVPVGGAGVCGCDGAVDVVFVCQLDFSHSVAMVTWLFPWLSGSVTVKCKLFRFSFCSFGDELIASVHVFPCSWISCYTRSWSSFLLPAKLWTFSI